MTTYFDNLFQELQQQRKNECIDINAIMETDISKFCDLSKNSKNALYKRLNDILSLKEKIALSNYAGYFNNGMGESDFVALDISKLSDYGNTYKYGDISELFEYNRVQILSENGYIQYFLYDGCSDEITLFDECNAKKYFENMLPGNIDYIIDMSLDDENISIGDLFKKVINESLSYDLMQW